ncbi:hypothetical protein V500_00025 [Pseudogymnoascus sp. VKM F-4518 (FW-2643)]|nr:hypothetical protein V500_00025 [Pseudogymnoascus sp. VKM F-4518 (FW-2643)]
MDAIQIYAIAAGGTLCIFAFVNLLPLLIPLVTRISNFVSKHFRYPYILHRHRILGPWTRAGVVIQLAYLAINLFCVVVVLSWDGLKAVNFSDAGRRAGTLAEVNMIPLLAGPHFAFLADLLGLSLKTIRGIHRSAGWMTAALVLLHAMAAASDGPLPIDVSQNLFAVVGASLLCLLLVLLLPLFRKLSYELFLRSHQALALASIYAVWRHVPSDKSSPRAYIYITMGIFAATYLLQTGAVIVRNGVFRHQLSRATITHDAGAVKMQLRLSKPLTMDAGQYINLWIPSVSFWSFLQTHPFTVISWDAKDQDRLDLLIEPRRGLTRELLYHAKKCYTINPLVVFSGPHGASLSMGEYESVLMVASGFGIAAFVPHLKKLIYGYNTRAVRTRRIHLVWQIKNEGGIAVCNMQIRTKANSVADGLTVQELLNIALEEDKLDDGCILSISVYVETKSSPKKPFGERATLYPGPAPLSEIFLAELSGNNIKVHAAEVGAEGEKALEQSESTSSTLQGDAESGSRWTVTGDKRILVAVSGSEVTRDDLRAVVRKYIRVGRIVKPRRVLLAGWHSKGYPRGRGERLGLWRHREDPPGTLVPRGGSPQEHPLPRRILLGSLPSEEDPPRRILPGARTSKEFAPGSPLLRGQGSLKTLSPERTPPGGLDSCEPTAPHRRQPEGERSEMLSVSGDASPTAEDWYVSPVARSQILTPDSYMENAKDMYDEGYEADEFNSYMAIYKSVHGICSEQRSIIDEGADLILSSIFCALPLLREVRLSFREVKDDDWLASDMIIKEEFYKHHLHVVSSAIHSARSVGVAIHTVSLLHFNLPSYHSWEQPNLDPLSESLRQLLGNIKVLRVRGVDDRVLELLPHCVLDLQQLDMCGVVAPEKVIQDFFETNKKSIRSIGFHDVVITELNRLDSNTPLSASMLCRRENMVCSAQQRGYNGCATTASAIAQRLSQPMWGKAVPGTRGVIEREQCYKLRAAPNNPVAHLGQAQSCARHGEHTGLITCDGEHYAFDHVLIMANLKSYASILPCLAPHRKYVIPSLTISSPGAKQVKGNDEKRQEWQRLASSYLLKMWTTSGAGCPLRTDSNPFLLETCNHGSIVRR